MATTRTKSPKMPEPPVDTGKAPPALDVREFLPARGTYLTWSHQGNPSARWRRLSDGRGGPRDALREYEAVRQSCLKALGPHESVFDVSWEGLRIRLSLSADGKRRRLTQLRLGEEVEFDAGASPAEAWKTWTTIVRGMTVPVTGASVELRWPTAYQLRLTMVAPPRQEAGAPAPSYGGDDLDVILNS